ncbi:histidine phosphatase superfamily protein (branch 1) [Paenibacillus taihuensis]|uniref:Histidine phosphatase superfamily protein (Branch 1) n=1 Tax=Paenibacillus taihuensis TaxID=1156355 RepID=A0A3D9SCE8_9BACL|nr:histidine phosphatase family protein [Paenibacillus taihuensis]REE91573.1 histidine phosphatase superfamily protein (branch 1) [Paenibacillus taihuensis]
MHLKLRIILVIYAFVFLFAASEVDARKIEIGNDTAILDNLKMGGYILYFRHGEATIGQDQPDLNLNDCRTQRNLSNHGREQAQAIGDVFKKNPFPVHFPVISDPYCRAKDTADIIFGKENITVAPILASIEKLKIESLSAFEKQQILSDLTKIFETPPARGKNTVIVAHTFPPNVALGEIPNLGAVIIKPKGSGNGYEVVGRITSEELIRWSDKP